MRQELNSARVTDLASELAAVTGEDMETAVVSALEERLARLARPGRIENGDEIDALFERLARMPVRDRRSPDEILGYDVECASSRSRPTFLRG
jgi:antitoxin VapB